MALKFLNKKGWHTGSLRNIENVWKAEQKHGAEQKKLDELRKQIQEERERSEFRLLQEQAGLVPKQERLDFLYESGLAVGKGSSEGFKTLEALPKTETDASSSATQQASVPGALFEEKPQSANDAWRKLHSDPLLMIRQREQDALARIKNNPVQMARIRKSVEEKKKDKKKHERKENRKHHHKNPSREKNSSSKASFNSESITEENKSYHSNSKHKEHSRKDRSDLEVSARKKEEGRKRSHPREDYSSKGQSDSEVASSEEEDKRHPSHHKSKRQKHSPDSQPGRRERGGERENRSGTHRVSSSQNLDLERETAATRHKHHRQTASTKLSEEERSAKLREMEMDAKLHDEQRWNRIKKASEDDAREASRKGSSSGRNFLNAAQRSIYGAEKGGSSTIEESVRRRTHYLQGRSEAEGNAFRR